MGHEAGGRSRIQSKAHFPFAIFHVSFVIEEVLKPQTPVRKERPK